MGRTLLIDPALGANPADPSVVRAAYAQRAFPRSQELLEGPGTKLIRRPLSATWHDLGLSPYYGAFAIVDEDQSDLAALVGGVLRITAGPRSALVVVVASTGIDEDISLARRAYLALAPWNIDPLLISAEIVYGV